MQQEEREQHLEPSPRQVLGPAPLPLTLTISLSPPLAHCACTENKSGD